MRGQHTLLATWLYRFIETTDSDVLPTAKMLGIKYHVATGEVADAYSVCAAFEMLERDRKITRRTGTRSENRGHQAIRIMATGRALKTAGCPFEAPETLRRAA